MKTGEWISGFQGRGVWWEGEVSLATKGLRDPCRDGTVWYSDCNSVNILAMMFVQ